MASMLEEARVSILVTQQHLLGRLPDHQPRAGCLDTEWSIITRESGEPPVNGTTGGDLPYVIYTSGSTGKPQGGKVGHRSVDDWHELIAGLRVESLEFPPEIRTVVIGGERARRQPLMAWQRYVGSRVRLLNTYGPTEVTIAATICDLTSTELSRGPLREVPIGRAIQNVQVYVLDRNLQPVPIETPGELYIGGVGLARGYLERADLTAERFIP